MDHRELAQALIRRNSTLLGRAASACTKARVAVATAEHVLRSMARHKAERERRKAVIAAACARVTTSGQVIRSSERLLQQSAELISPSAFSHVAGSLRHARRIQESMALQTRREQTLVHGLREAGSSSREYAKVMVLISKETRLKVRQTRTESSARLARSQQLLCSVRRNAQP